MLADGGEATVNVEGRCIRIGHNVCGHFANEIKTNVTTARQRDALERGTVQKNKFKASIVDMNAVTINRVEVRIRVNAGRGLSGHLRSMEVSRG